MKILKILFLGIVLVVFNLTYLAAANLPDTLLVKASGAEPGGVLTLTIDMRIHSTGTGGFLNLFGGIPNGIAQTAHGELASGATAPTDAGGWWYQWTAFGTTLKTLATTTLIRMDDAEDGSNKLLTSTLLGVNIDFLATAGLISSKSGEVLKVSFNVPADMPEGTYTLTPDPVGNLIFKYPVDQGTFTDLPVVIVDPIVVAVIPDNNQLALVATQGAASGKSVNVAVKIANRDTVGSGSFTVDYPGGTLTLKGVTAGARAGGATFGYTIADVTTALAAAGDKRATVTFTGGVIPTGGSGELCSLSYDVASVGAGATASVTLASVALNNPTGTGLSDIVQPSASTDETALSFFFGDTLSLGVMQGARTLGQETAGIAKIMNGKLYVPVMLKNSSPVASLRFYVQEGPVDKVGILSLDANPVANISRATGWWFTTADSGSYVQVIGLANTTTDVIAAGNGALFELVYDIDITPVPAEGEGVDIDLMLKGVEVIDDQGTSLGVEKIDGVATIDHRVPTAGEGISQGASLPKAFALSQNHPNPFNPSTTINYQIPDETGNVAFTLNVYDIRGRLVKTLDRGMKSPGYYSSFWDGTDNNGSQVSSGVYFYRFTSSAYNATRKMILLK